MQLQSHPWQSGQGRVRMRAINFRSVALTLALLAALSAKAQQPPGSIPT